VPYALHTNAQINAQVNAQMEGGGRGGGEEEAKTRLQSNDVLIFQQEEFYN
jgi:hypothetical protein